MICSSVADGGSFGVSIIFCAVLRPDGFGLCEKRLLIIGWLSAEVRLACHEAYCGRANRYASTVGA